MPGPLEAANPRMWNIGKVSTNLLDTLEAREYYFLRKSVLDARSESAVGNRRSESMVQSSRRFKLLPRRLSLNPV